jgi:hypothetical protein
MRDWCDNLTADRNIQDSKYNIVAEEGTTGRMFIHPITQAKLTYGASLGIIERFCSTLVSYS